MVVTETIESEYGLQTHQYPVYGLVEHTLLSLIAISDPFQNYLRDGMSHLENRFHLVAAGIPQQSLALEAGDEAVRLAAA